MITTKLYLGDIVLLNFPFTDGITYKKRPALIVNDCEDGDIIVCRITSQIYNSFFDIFIENWESCGLKLPSIIRVHKIASLEKIMADIVLGKISSELQAQLRNKICALLSRINLLVKRIFLPPHP